MKSFLFKLRRWIVFSIAAVLIFLALTQGAVRLLLPVAHDQRQRLAAELSQLLKADVTVGRIDSHWNYFVPYLDLLDIRIQQAAESTQKLERLSVGMNILDMLRAGSFAPSSLQIDGLNIVLAKTPDGQFYLPGLQLPQKSDQPLSIDWESLLSHKGVSLSNARFVVRHEGENTQLDFADIELDFTSSGSRYKGVLTLLPPEKLAAKTRIAFDLQGELSSLKTWQGKIDVNIPPIQLQELTPYLPASVQIKQGHFALALELQLNQKGIASSRGELDLVADFVGGEKLRWQSPLSAHSQADSLNLSMNSPLTVGAKDLSMLKGLGLQLGFSDRLSWGFYFKELDLLHSSELVQALTELPAPWPRRLAAMQAGGKLKNFFAGWDSLNGWNASVKLQDFTLQSVDKLPGISGLNADVLLKQDILSVDIQDQAFEFDTEGLFPEVFAVQRLATRLDVYKDNEDWIIAAPSLFLDTADIKTHSYFEMRLADGKKPFLTLNASAEEGDAAQTMRYVPTFLKPATLAWFKQAFIGGRVVDADAYIKGYVNELARENSDAIFRIDAKVADATFSYAKGWPIVENLDATFHMDGVRMEVEAQAAEVFAVKPRLVKAVIPNCRQTSLELSIDAPHSPMQSLLRYVTDSPLNNLVGGAGGLFEGSGHADVSLSLRKNISKRHYSDLKPYFDGVIRLQETRLNLPSLDVQLDQLSGSVDFSHKHVASENLAGRINQQSFTGQASTRSTDAGPRALLNIDAQLSLQDVIKTKAPMLTDRITGRSTWNGRIEIPLSKGQKSASLSASTKLQGTAINFPAPLNKDANTPAQMDVFIALNKTASNRIWLDYKSTLQGVLVFDRDKGGLYSGRINYLSGKPELPRGPGVVVDAAVKQLDVDPWIEFASAQGGDSVRENVLQRINFKSDVLRYKGVAVKQAEGVLKQQAEHWKIAIEGEGLKGELKLPKDKAETMDVSLNLLNLNKLVFPEGAQQAHAEPKQIPSTTLSVDQFTWNDINLSNLSADLRSVETGLRVESYKINDPDLHVVGEGSWQSDADGLQRSFMEFKASTKNMKLGLQKIGVNNLLKRGEGQFNGTVNWKKPPYQLDFPSLSGTIKGEVKRGDLLSVKPGIAKLFGLLNVQSLPKRLALDFKDLSSKGLAFDKARTSISLEQGIASFNYMKIDTDLGEINIEGRTDLVKQELDQIAKVNPDVSNIIPITAGVVGGLPGLVGALLVDQVVKAFGGDTDRVAQVRYKINGQWDNPKVELTRVERVKDLTPEQLRQRAEDLVIKAQGIDYEQDVVPGKLELSDDEEQSLFKDE